MTRDSWLGARPASLVIMSLCYSAASPPSCSLPVPHASTHSQSLPTHPAPCRSSILLPPRGPSPASSHPPKSRMPESLPYPISSRPSPSRPPPPAQPLPPRSRALVPALSPVAPLSTPFCRAAPATVSRWDAQARLARHRATSTGRQPPSTSAPRDARRLRRISSLIRQQIPRSDPPALPLPPSPKSWAIPLLSESLSASRSHVA